MRFTTPHVTGGRLNRSNTESNPIVVGTPAWYDWVEQQAAFIYVDAAGTFTARKSMLRTGESYWKAYRARQGKLYRIHLGHSHTLTLEKLQATAQGFVGEHGTNTDDVLSTQFATSGLSKRTSSRKALTVDGSMALLQTKLSGPRKRSDLITRTRLIECLNAGLSGKVTLVSAPAGFGKTTLIAQWVQMIDRPTAWLSLDEHDNALRVFVRSLTAALQRAFPDAFHGIANLLEAPRFPTIEYVIPLFTNDLADVPDDLILVLDDYHLIRNHVIHTLIDQLIEQLPPHLHLVFISRSDPPLPLARWRAQGYLNVLRLADLRFTLEETEAFLTQELGSVVTHETAVALEEWTEGWIAVLRLAALSLRTTSDAEAFMERLRSLPDHAFSSYLVEEVLVQLAPDEQELLVKTSVLEQFCAELCVAILGSDTSYEYVQVTLDRLERSNLFLVPLDEHQGWYRFHHLFQQLLQQRLQEQCSTEEIAALHRRASAWYAEQGLIEEALEHALAAGDSLSATQLVEAHFLSAFKQEQWVQLERWLGLLSEEQIQGSPWLLVARLWILHPRGHFKDFPRLLDAAERLLETSCSGASDLDDPQHKLLHALVAILRSQFQYFTGQVQESLESARSALEWLPPGEEYIASYALMLLAWSYQATGQEEGALLELNDALNERSTNLTSTARLLFAQAWVYLAEGKLHQAEYTARHLLQIAQRADLALSHYWAHWLLGVVHYEWNNLDAAVYHFSVVIANQNQAHFWVVRDALCGLALIYQAQGLSTQVQETVRTLLALLQEQHNMREILTAYSFCGQLALLQGEVEQASQWLELAGEQDVLGPMMFLEDPPITKAWLLLAKGDEVSIAHGQALLTHLTQYVEVIHSTRKTINVLALQAWAYDLQGRACEALEVLERALALAGPGGFIRTFANMPQLVTLLRELRKGSKACQEVDQTLDRYLQHILAAISTRAASPVSTETLLLQEGLDSLTDRELYILRLLDQDLTNKEIARKLVVTTGTVNVHTSNIYRKLGVNNRRSAVSMARALGFLRASQAGRPQLQ